jgi:hypothetical protein
MSKREHIPETRDVKPNREQRRHPERLEDTPLARDPVGEHPPDVEDPRAKSSGHKKKTADKWNQ